MSFTDGVTVASLALNLLLLLFQSQTKTAVAELRSNIYRDFVLKSDLPYFTPSTGARHRASS